MNMDNEAPLMPSKDSKDHQKPEVDKSRYFETLKKLATSRTPVILPKQERRGEFRKEYYPYNVNSPPSDEFQKILPQNDEDLQSLIADFLKETRKCPEEEQKVSTDEFSEREKPEKIKREKTDLEKSYDEFIKPNIYNNIRFARDPYYKCRIEEPQWNPLVDLASEMSMIPEDELKKWLLEHVKQFASDFDWDNNTRDMLTLNETEINKTESEVIRDYCLSLFKLTLRRFDFLRSQFPNIRYACCCEGLPTEIPGHEPPPLDDKKIVVLAVKHLKKRQTYPAVVIVPTGYLMHPNDYKLLKESLQRIGNRWSDYKEFYGIITNFKTTIFTKYDRDEKKHYQWQHVVNFNECFLKNESLDKLENFYRIWLALLYRAMQVYSNHISSN